MAPSVALSTQAFITKQEIREAIFTDTAETDRADDELNTLYNMVNWVCAAVEERVNIPIIQQTYIEYFDGGGEYVFLTRTPVVSITSVTEDDVTLTASVADGYKFDQALGAVRRLSPTDATVASTFTEGILNVKVEYKAGFGTQTRAQQGGELTSVSGVPDDYKLAAYAWIQHLWAKGPENYTPEQGYATGSRAAIPYEVKEILISHQGQQHWVG